MSCCPNNTGASVSPCPNCDGKGATTSPPPCQCQYNLGPIPTCCCMSDNQAPGGCCQQPSTFTMSLPSTLSVTLGNKNLCPCVSGGFDVTYDPTNDWWIGSGSLGTCGHTVQIKFGCGSTGGDNCCICCWWMSIHYPDACAGDQLCGSPLTDLCGPPATLEFDWPGPVPCGCSTGVSQGWKAVVTL